jgi:hypothetical protein
MSAPVTMQSHAANYLSERRRLGFQLRGAGLAVMSFARYVDALGRQGENITSDTPSPIHANLSSPSV